MKHIILCSSSTLLIKNLYGILRDEGYCVDIIEHPSFAVQLVLNRKYDLVIIDSEPFGMSAEDAANIINRVAPETAVMVLGSTAGQEQAQSLESPVDLEEFKRTLHAIPV
jgi:DNA-binding response OmpR family regulator